MVSGFIETAPRPVVDDVKRERAVILDMPT